MGQKWEIAMLPYGEEPIGSEWEPFGVGNEQVGDSLELRVLWRRAPEGKTKGSQWLTTREACDAIGVTAPTLHGMVKLGQLPAPVKIGGGARGMWRWSRPDVEKLVSRARGQ